MNRRTLLLAPLAVVAISAAAGCGGSSTASTADPTELINAGNAAVKNATSVGFDVKLSLDLNGQLNAPQAATILNGPVTVELKGHAAKSQNGSPAAFDATFTVDTSAASITGEVHVRRRQDRVRQDPGAARPGPGNRSRSISTRAARVRAPTRSIRPARWTSAAEGPQPPELAQERDRLLG